MTVSYAGVGEAADKVLADAEARAQSPSRAGDLVPDVFQPRHPRLQCAHGRLQLEVALGLAPEVGLHAAQPQLPVLAAPPAGLVVEVAHAPVLERRHVRLGAGAALAVRGVLAAYPLLAVLSLHPVPQRSPGDVVLHAGLADGLPVHDLLQCGLETVLRVLLAPPHAMDFF